MSNDLTAHCKINGGHFLLNLALFMAAAMLAMIYMPNGLAGIGIEAFLAATVLVIMLDAAFSVSSLGAAALPILSSTLGMVTAEEMRCALECGEIKKIALLILISVPLHLCISAYGFEYSLCLHRLKRQSDIPDRAVCRRLYILITVALLVSASAFAAMILNR